MTAAIIVAAVFVAWLIFGRIKGPDYRRRYHTRVWCPSALDVIRAYRNLPEGERIPPIAWNREN